MGALDCWKRAGYELWEEDPRSQLSPKQVSWCQVPALLSWVTLGSRNWGQMVLGVERVGFTSSQVSIDLKKHRAWPTKRKAVSQIGCTSLHCVTWAKAEMTPGKMSLRCGPYSMLMPSMSPVWSQAALVFRKISPWFSFRCCCCLSLPWCPFHQ